MFNDKLKLLTKNIFILSGAGIDADSGLQTFRSADGLWAGEDIMAIVFKHS